MPKQLYPVSIILTASTLLGISALAGLITPSAPYFSAVLVVVGALLGATLNYFHFGFSSSFRALILDRRTAGMRAILVMLALAIVLFAPLMALPQFADSGHSGFIRPLSLSIPIGAFIFGIGMQIGCGCTSGTLNRVGQMQSLALPTLLFMIIGGTFAAATFGEWRQLPAIEPIAFQNSFSWPLAIIVQLGILAALYGLLLKIENRKHQNSEKLLSLNSNGYHPFLLAAIGLAIFNSTLFLISGSPWSISSVFPYWGTKLMDLFTVPIDWTFWDYAMENPKHLSSPLFESPVSLTTIGVILGALIVSLLKPRDKVSFSSKGLMASIIGGTIMGFGAVLASGCNIGAFFSGIASGSLHGWVWLLFALVGNVIGLQLRKKII